MESVFFSVSLNFYIIFMLSPTPFYFVFVSFSFIFITEFKLEIYGVLGP